MDGSIIAVASAVGTAVLGSIVTYATGVLNIRRDLAAKYDADLRRERIGVYKDLWKKLQPLARYSPEKALSRNDCHHLAAALRAWYFEDGGLYLSEPAREAYFKLQDGLKVIDDHSDKPIGDHLPALMALGSTLRTQLTRDVGTRAQPMLKE